MQRMELAWVQVRLVVQLMSAVRFTQMVTVFVQCVFSDCFMIYHGLNFDTSFHHYCLKHFLVDLLAFLSLFSLCAKCMSAFLNYSVFCFSVIRKHLTDLFRKNLEFFL